MNFQRHEIYEIKNEANAEYKVWIYVYYQKCDVRFIDPRTAVKSLYSS